MDFFKKEIIGLVFKSTAFETIFLLEKFMDSSQITVKKIESGVV